VGFGLLYKLNPLLSISSQLLPNFKGYYTYAFHYTNLQVYGKRSVVGVEKGGGEK
jgi:hypothetical protein